MSLRIGINGFGRIGRSVFRILSERSDMQVVAVNDLFDNQQLAYLLSFDTVMGVFPKPVRADETHLYIGDEKVLMTAERDPAAAALGRAGSGCRGRVHRRLPSPGQAREAPRGRRQEGRADRAGQGRDRRH